MFTRKNCKFATGIIEMAVSEMAVSVKQKE
jgi:hypothetical protein